MFDAASLTRYLKFVTFSSGIDCEACGLEMVMGKARLAGPAAAIFGPVLGFSPTLIGNLIDPEQSQLFI